MRDTVIQLPTVQVESTRGANDRSSATVVRMNRAEAMRFLPSTTADIIRNVPGVNIVKTGPWSSRIFMRGLGGDRVAVMMDDLRLNTVRGHGAQSSSIPVEWVQSVEVLPGASSTIYGSDALAGAINFQSHRSLFAPAPAASFTLSADAGEPGGLRSQNLRTALMTKQFGLELRGNLRRVEALHLPTGQVANSGDHGENLSGRTSFSLGQLLADYEHLHLAARDVGLPAFSSAQGSTGVYPLQGREADRIDLQRIGGGRTPDLRLLVGLQTLRNDFTETTVTPRSVRGNYVGSTTNAASDRVTTTARAAQPSLRFRGPFELRVLGEIREERAGGPRNTMVTVRDAAGSTTSETMQTGASMPTAVRDAYSVAALLADTLLSLRLEGGVRWDALHSRADSTGSANGVRLDTRDEHVSFEGGFSRVVGPVVPYGRAATGFRAPNLEERYYNNEIHGGMRLYGNPDLVSETSRVFELGLRSAAPVGSSDLSGRVSAYRTDVDNLITFGYIDQLYGIPRFQYQNVRRARIEGVEAELSYRHESWFASVSGSFPRGRDLDSGERLTDLGAHRAALDLGAPVPVLLPNGHFAARILWSGPIHSTSATLERPSFVTLSTEASCVIAGVRAVLAVENVTNHLYQEPVSFISSPGREFTFSLRREFRFDLSHEGPNP
jgi:hemoglobin/transferrin/lactoferrin receptor protein